MKQRLFLITVLLIVFASSASWSCIDVYNRNDFPDGFIFGSAISAFQWEGAVDEDGRTPSIWDTFANSSNGDIGCDGYHKYKEDVRLMHDIGLDAFRFSISWPRLIPNGRGHVNPQGLRFYKSLIDELKRHGIEPHVTLYHNDLPQVLEDEYGGWINRRIIDDFTAFANVCFREFGNEVKFWTTINEPNMLAMGGYDLGFVPPMHCSPPFGMFNCSRGNSSTEPYIALHNMLLAHASTAKLYNQKYKDKQNGSIGIACFAYWLVPLTSSEEDEVATQRAKDFLLGWVLHPLVFGDYPDVMKRIAGNRLPTFSEEESDLVKDSFDFLGLIHYTTLYITHLSYSRLGDYISDMNAALLPIGNSTMVKFDVLPWGLEAVLEYLKQNYRNPPIYILENGQPTNHYSSSLHDEGRVNYLHAYITSVLKSMRNGSDTRGYFQWSFMDLYEFIDPNYTYGLYYVNFSDSERKRTPKLSAHWYSAFLKGKNNSFLGSQGIEQLQKNFSSSTSFS